MAELMIAIVILGLGLLTVATMFPIAWTKARDLAEFTSQVAITDSAQNTLSVLAQVSRRVNDAEGYSSSFKGDPVPPGAAIPEAAEPDPWVHPLHMQNLLATNPSSTPTDIPQVVGDFEDFNGAFAPNNDFELNPPGFVGYTEMPNVQVAIHERIYPPMPPLPNDGDPSEVKGHWNDVLSQRRYCWAAFHKLDYDRVNGPLPTWADPRAFTVYFVTLRRGQPTHRYARQDPVTDPGNEIPLYVNPRNGLDVPLGLPTSSAVPRALPATEDVVFPVPWRVQIEIVPPVGSGDVPAQAITNSAAYPSNSLVTDMIQRGSVLIDELSGKVYEVTSREPDPATPTRAMVTLDQVITTDDFNKYGALRTVWVFPPPAERDPSGAVIGFSGPQPVVGVEVRRMTFWP